MNINGVASIDSQPSALPPFGVTEIRKRTRAVQEVMRGVMREGTHYGTIPGTPKPSLWKAGAEVLCMTFRLAPLLESRVTVDAPESEWIFTTTKRDGSILTGTCLGFFEVEASCSIQGPTGDTLSRCSARCNNREAKYRGLSFFDIRNTIQKMAEKRAFVSAVLMATGASDIFTQDMEDFPDVTDPVMPSHVPAEPRPSSPKPGGKQPLTPKREAWLFRAAKESSIPQEIVDRCLGHLRIASPESVNAFFDDLAQRKKVFAPFVGTAT